MHGPTKFFFEDENIDRLFAMVTALGAEISKVDEKLDTVLRLLERKQVIEDAEVARFEPTAEEQAARDTARRLFIETLLAPFQLEADALVARAGKPLAANPIG
jgi:hypothetical protein